MLGTSSSNPLGRIKILLIEDDNLVREIIVRMLKNVGVTEIVEASSAETGWVYLAGERSRPFHVVITDLTLPGMSGSTFIKKIRELPSAAAKALPIIVLTGSLDMKIYNKVAENNVSSYLIKPISSNLLRAALEKAVLLKPSEISAAS